MLSLSISVFYWDIYKNEWKDLKILFLEISWWITKIQICNKSHFKAFGMMNLQYEIRICQIIYNKVTMTAYVSFDLTCIRRYVRPFSVLAWGNMVIFWTHYLPLCPYVIVKWSLSQTGTLWCQTRIWRRWQNTRWLRVGNFFGIYELYHQKVENP